jgi:hypothetical protein
MMQKAKKLININKKYESPAKIVVKSPLELINVINMIIIVTNLNPELSS